MHCLIKKESNTLLCYIMKLGKGLLVHCHYSVISIMQILSKEEAFKQLKIVE